jgi:hypothetical protein
MLQAAQKGSRRIWIFDDSLRAFRPKYLVRISQSSGSSDGRLSPAACNRCQHIQGQSFLRIVYSLFSKNGLLCGCFWLVPTWKALHFSQRKDSNIFAPNHVERLCIRQANKQHLRSKAAAHCVRRCSNSAFRQKLDSGFTAYHPPQFAVNSIHDVICRLTNSGSIGILIVVLGYSLIITFNPSLLYNRNEKYYRFNNTLENIPLQSGCPLLVLSTLKTVEHQRRTRGPSRSLQFQRSEQITSFIGVGWI